MRYVRLPDIAGDRRILDPGERIPCRTALRLCLQRQLQLAFEVVHVLCAVRTTGERVEYRIKRVCLRRQHRLAATEITSLDVVDLRCQFFDRSVEWDVGDAEVIVGERRGRLDAWPQYRATERPRLCLLGRAVHIQLVRLRLRRALGFVLRHGPPIAEM